jgi:tRNA-specific 2-thiouridylase
MQKVIIGMSGGVDSSVAAWLLQKQGYQVEGLFMNNWSEDDTSEYCSSAIDLADAQAVCHQLKIPLHTVNFSKEYWDNVFEYFLEEYRKGRTPNPDVLCNKEIKFKVFYDYAMNMGADFVATGHYARTKSINNQFHLVKAKDRSKDQTYFLHAINPDVLSHVLFPIGDYLKSEIRNFATELGLITKDKKDSTGICFIGERPFKDFLQEYILAKPGPIQSSTGALLGSHDGLMFYTLGQRQGLGIGGNKQFGEEPWYVVDKDTKKNTLIVAQGKDHPRLFSQGLICEPIHWLTQSSKDMPLTCYAKTRYRQQEQACMIAPKDENNRHTVLFSSPQRAVTPGQYIVFYDGNCCIGGAVISSIIR